MKASALLLAATAALAVAGCNSDKKAGDAGSGNAAASVEPIKPPAGGDWTQMVRMTDAGGVLMGNPEAPVKVIEFGSMTCPHCAEFEETGVQPLVDKYVKTGRVSFEFRNYIRDPYDLTASLIARCNGADGFFPLTKALFKDQKAWIAKLQQVPPAQQQALATMGPGQQFLEIAKLAGLQDWAAVRGLPAAKSTTCLTNEGEVTRLVQMTSDAAQYQLPGTPAFLINDKLVDGSTWEKLEPAIQDAIG